MAWYDVFYKPFKNKEYMSDKKVSINDLRVTAIPSNAHSPDSGKIIVEGPNGKIYKEINALIFTQEQSKRIFDSIERVERNRLENKI